MLAATDWCSEVGRLEAMLIERAISIIGIIVGSSLVTVAIAGEVTDCQARVNREGPDDLTHWSWRSIDGQQCWYRGDRWKPKHELRWAEALPSAAPGAVDQPATDNHTDGLDTEPGRPQPEIDKHTDGLDAEPGGHQPERPTELTGLDAAGLTSIDDAPEEWRAKFADQLLANTCCWPEAELTDFELTGNVELGDTRPGVRPAQPLWPILFLLLALLPAWQLVRGLSSRVFRAYRGGASQRA
jgi:hypothetical protein